MSKIGVTLNINVSKLQKEHFFEGKQGKYVELKVFIDPDNPDQYGQHGGVKQTWKECDDKAQDFVGNAKVFWKEDGGKYQPSREEIAREVKSLDDDLPF